MAKKVQLRRGTEAEHENFVGAEGELTVDVTNKALRLHDGQTIGGVLVTSSGTPLGIPLWHNGLRSKIDTGYVAMDGQLLKRADFPILWETIQRKYTVVSESIWLQHREHRGKFSSGDGSTTFRIPDLNGYQTGSLKGLFLRGGAERPLAEIEANLPSGTVLGDAIRNITGDIGNSRSIDIATPTGAFFAETTTGNANGSGSTATQIYSHRFDASRVVPTAYENRPVSAVGVWICRIGSTVAEVSDKAGIAKLVGGNAFTGDQQITGNIVASGNITGFSDKRLKTNIKPVEQALDKVEAITGVTYNRIDINDGREHVGVLAQDVQAVIPQAVIESEEGTLTVDYMGLTGVLIQAIKELRKEVQELKDAANKRRD